MKVFINNEPIDIQLENEKTLMDLYNSMQDEARKFNRYITNFEYNIKNPDKENQKNPNMENIFLEDIDSVYFQIGDLKEMLLNTLYNQNQYIDQLGTKIYESDQLTENEIQQIKEGIQWIKEVIYLLSNLLDVPIEKIKVKMPEKEHKDLKSNLEQLEYFVFQLNKENFQNLKDSIINYLRVVRSFSNQYFNQLLSKNLSKEEIIEYLTDFYNNIDNLQNTLIEINTKFQIGEDHRALQSLQALLEKLEVYFFIFSSSLEKVENHEYKDIIQKKLNEILNVFEDLSSAMNEMDIVTVGDILEYVLTEKLNIIKKFIPTLKKILTEGNSIKK